MKYVIGNWKANKNISETNLWLNTFLNFDFSHIQNRSTLIICPPFPLIPLVKEKLTGILFIIKVLIRVRYPLIRLWDSLTMQSLDIARDVNILMKMMTI